MHNNRQGTNGNGQNGQDTCTLYAVILPSADRLDLGEHRDLASAYTNIGKIGFTYARSDREAISHFFWKSLVNCSNGGEKNAKRILYLLKQRISGAKSRSLEGWESMPTGNGIDELLNEGARVCELTDFESLEVSDEAQLSDRKGNPNGKKMYVSLPRRAVYEVTLLVDRIIREGGVKLGELSPEERTSFYQEVRKLVIKKFIARARGKSIDELLGQQKETKK